MSRTIRKAIAALTGTPDAPSAPGTALAPTTPGPPAVSGPVPTPSPAPLPTPAPPPARNLPAPTPTAPPVNGGSGWGTAAKVGLAVATGGGLLGAINALTNDSYDPNANAPPADPQPPAPPAAPPQPPIDPSTATPDQLVAAGFRDYGSGLTAPGGNASGVPDHWRRKMFLKQQAVRYRQEFAKNPAMYGDMVAAYDAQPSGPGSAHSARALATRALTDHLDAQKAAQIGINVDNQAKQNNIARQMGMTRGQVMAMDDVSASVAKGDIASASAKAAMYAEQYGPAFLYAARNMTDQHSASEKAKAEMAGQKPPPKTVAESVQENMAAIQALPPGPGRKAAIESFYQTANGGPQADPKMVAQAVKNHYQTVVRDMAGRLNSLSPEELSELQQVAGGMSYQQFQQYSGMPDTPANQQSYQRIFGKNATWGQWYQNLTPWND